MMKETKKEKKEWTTEGKKQTKAKKNIIYVYKYYTDRIVHKADVEVRIC
jgi:predicted ribonuclease toxin of YeeF-YezG toxin-antitoxin module